MALDNPDLSDSVELYSSAEEMEADSQRIQDDLQRTKSSLTDHTEVVQLQSTDCFLIQKIVKMAI